MKMSTNTILITGGGSGIGRAWAEEFHKLGNQVIVSGRRREALDVVTAANPGMQSAIVDVQDPAALQRFTAQITQQYPSLNVLINNAGIMQRENLLDPSSDLSIAEATISTNLLAPMRLIAGLLPLLKKQPRATIVNVTSGLAFLPLAFTPTYCATKAALHSYTQSLRYQLKDTPVEVIELVPPYIATELTGPSQASDPHAMPLAEYIAEVMEIFRSQSAVEEVCVKRVHPLRFAAEQGQPKYEEAFRNLNAARATAP